MGKKRDIPTYEQTHPPHLATTDALADEGLKATRDQLPAALLKYKGEDFERLSALYERALCVPIEQKPETP
ncbi:hypothetical protein [Deinococcus hopiensis]|uniref:Uncharacterized protein n=1 Tax=Deinococcus hopiensis KR-140 TaxID=695939 RepID=A0A1W1UZB2_9DEIO|nr:hypothetical protein [Deinococcus hopiensis]SMB86443.1 hypothetical protein SAMN00790413_03814 [Deinococcus hopiensis KR-140]